jgi:hypothetical protein
MEGIFMHHHINQNECMTSITRIISEIVEDNQTNNQCRLKLITTTSPQQDILILGMHFWSRLKQKPNLSLSRFISIFQSIMIREYIVV